MKFFSELRLYICNHIICNIPSHWIRLLYYRNIMNFKIGSDSTIFLNCKFDCAGGLTIGNNCVINANCRLDSRGKLFIGNNVSFSEEVICLTADDNEELTGASKREKSIIIDDFVWIGTRAMILPGINLKKGALVAAGAIVTRNVEYLNVVAGAPAKKISMRSNKFDYSTNYMRLFQ